VSGNPPHGYDGTYQFDGLFNNQHSWRCGVGQQYIWYGSLAPLWFINEAKHEPIDLDNAGFHHAGPGGPTGTYWWWEMSHVDVTEPQTAQSYNYGGVHELWPRYYGDNELWYVWRNPADQTYYLSNAYGAGIEPADAYWKADALNDPNNTYTPGGTAVGNITMNPGIDMTAEATRP